MLTFHRSFAKSILTYGLLLYGSANKTDIQRLENCPRRIIRGVVFKRKIDSLRNIYERHNLLTVFEMYIYEVFKELLKQLKSVSPLKFLTESSVVVPF